MKKGLIALALTGLLGAFGTGCSDPCGDLKDCCVAFYEAAELDDAGVCDGYDEADSDACDAAKDLYKSAPEGVDLPEECNFE